MKANNLIANTFALMALLFMVSIQTARAQTYLKAGEASVNLGETTTINLGNAYKRTLDLSTGITYLWWSDNTNYVTIGSNTRERVVVRGKAVTTSPVKVYYRCSYFIDGFPRNMYFYYEVTVKATGTVSVTKVELSKSSASMEVGKTLRLYATVYPTNAPNQNVSWSSNNKTVATVNSYGVVTAKTAGTAVISCISCANVNKYATCKITVHPATVVSSCVLPVSISNSDGTQQEAYLGTAFVDYPISISKLTEQGVTAYIALGEKDASYVNVSSTKYKYLKIW